MQKTASQLNDVVLRKLAFQGRMGFEASRAVAAVGPVAPPPQTATAAPKPATPAAAKPPMPKTGAQIADEVILKLSKFPFRPAAPKYVTQAEMSMAREKNLSQLKPASKTAPSSMPTERKNLSEIPVWPHKTASQISDEVLEKLSGKLPMPLARATEKIRRAANKFEKYRPGEKEPGLWHRVQEAGRVIKEKPAPPYREKSAEGEEQLDPSLYEDTPARKRHWPMGAAGLLAGGAAAHYLTPSKMVKDYRATAKGLEGPAQAALEAHKPSYDPKLDKFTGVLPEEHMTHIKDVSSAGRPVRFNAPAHAAQKYFKSRAWQEAMPRTLLGAGLGLGGGLLASSLF